MGETMIGGMGFNGGKRGLIRLTCRRTAAAGAGRGGRRWRRGR